MLTVHVVKKARCPLSKQYITQVARVAARYEKRIHGIVTITFIGDTAIRTLNKKYRGVDRSTDVLSFAWNETPGVSAELGELYLSYGYIVRQAKRFGVTAREECVRMIVHGLLHITGYDHVGSSESKKMFALQEKIIKSVLHT